MSVCLGPGEHGGGAACFCDLSLIWTHFRDVWKAELLKWSSRTQGLQSQPPPLPPVSASEDDPNCCPSHLSIQPFRGHHTGYTQSPKNRKTFAMI